MSKYELAVVVNAQIDDEARTAVVDRAKELMNRALAQDWREDEG